MATLFQDPDLNDPQQTGQQPKQTAGQPLTSSSTAPIGPSGSVAPSGTPANQQGTGGAVNIQKYVDANSGAGNQLAGGIEKQVGNQANKVNNEVTAGTNAFNNAVQPIQSSFNAAPGVANNVFTNANDYTNSTGQLNPTSALSASQQNTLAQFGQLRDQGYNPQIQAAGTTAQTNYNQALNDQKSIQPGLANTEQGRFQLLQNAFGSPNYNRGDQRLDQLFLQTQPGVTQGLTQNLSNAANSVGKNVQNFGTTTSGGIKNLLDQSGSIAGNIQNLFNLGNYGAAGTLGPTGATGNQMAIQPILTDSQNRFATDKAAGQNAAALQAALSSPGKLTPAQIQQLGLTPGQSLWDVNNLTSYFDPGTTAPTLASAADPAEVARYRALMTLSANNGADAFGGGAVGGDKASNFNLAGLNSDLAAQSAYYNTTQPAALANAYPDLNPYANPAITGPRTPAELATYFQSQWFNDPAVAQSILNSGSIDNMLAAAQHAGLQYPTATSALYDKQHQWIDPLIAFLQKAQTAEDNVVGAVPTTG